jgi:hypothetical protein
LGCTKEARTTFYGDGSFTTFGEGGYEVLIPRHMGGALVVGLRAIKNVLAMFFFSFLGCVHLIVAKAGR